MVTTKDGDMLDELVWRHYGSSSGYVERVLEHNWRLSHRPEVLPAGLKVKLPDLTPPVQTISLWGEAE